MKNKKLIWSLITILVLVGLGTWFFGFKGKTDFKSGEVRINEAVFKVDIADTVATRAQGLSDREGMGEDYGMLFIFNSPSVQGFWMKDMKFPLDFVWINEDKVIGVTENVQPELGKSVFGLTIYNSPTPADKVLELNAGVVAKKGIKVGDVVKFTYD